MNATCLVHGRSSIPFHSRTYNTIRTIVCHTPDSHGFVFYGVESTVGFLLFGMGWCVCVCGGGGGGRGTKNPCHCYELQTYPFGKRRENGGRRGEVTSGKRNGVHNES